MTSQRGTTLVELLVASALGLSVVLASVALLKTHAALALQVEADLGASGGAVWALRSALRDIRRAGADPRQGGVGALTEARPDALTLVRDADADGTIDGASQETVGLFWTDRDGGRLSRRVGRQSMPLAAVVPPGGFRLRYFDREGRELAGVGALDAVERARVRRVEVLVGVEERLGSIRGRAVLAGAASVRVREGTP